ncbi:MAG TPA: hypothetical protein DCK93_16945 [Blastocatellia bacterium]|jgi:hypothetical protein|nr:hypothetical protein [Blastocatellia bacterium]HAF24562.1 hypothetical protein [Blastocatellia bacterium]
MGLASMADRAEKNRITGKKRAKGLYWRALFIIRPMTIFAGNWEAISHAHVIDESAGHGQPFAVLRWTPLFSEN